MTIGGGSIGRSALFFGTLTLFLSGCAIQPRPITPEELAERNASDREAAVAPIPVEGPLTLEEATARVLKYNLEHRTRILQESLALARLDVSELDMLPKLIAGVGYSSRDRENIRRAVDSVTGQPSLSNPFITSERSHTTADLGLTWNLLDAGVSYYMAQQNADRLLAAGERRRQAMHELIQRTRSAFWRAIAAERLEQAVRENLEEAERALADSQAMLDQRIRAPQEALRYQRNVLENLRLLESVERELSTARIELASLMGADPGARFDLVEPEQMANGLLDMPVAEMERIALLNNAELREEHYNARIAALETRKNLVKLLPGVSLDYGWKYDSDDFLINEYWRQGGLRVTFNLLNLLALPRQQRENESALAVAQTKRMALQMAVLTQVHLGRQYYASVLRQHQRASQISDIDSQLAAFSDGEASSGMISDLDRIAANVVSIMSTVRRYQSIARVEEAASQLQATLGLEPDIGSVDDMALAELTGVMQQELYRAFYVSAAAPAAEPESVPPALAVQDAQPGTRGEQDLLSQRLAATSEWLGKADGGFTLQLGTARGKPSEVEQFLRRASSLGLEDEVFVYRSDAELPHWGLLYGRFASVREAQRSANQLPVDLVSHDPFVRNISAVAREAN